MCTDSGTIAKPVCASSFGGGMDEPRTFGGTDGKFLVTGEKKKRGVSRGAKVSTSGPGRWTAR